MAQRDSGVAKRQSGLTEQEAKNPIYYEVEFQGFMTEVSWKGDYGFVSRETITRLDGTAKLGISLSQDLRLHVKKNRELGDPLPKDSWVRFFIGPDERSRDGVEAVGGRLLK